MYDMEKILAAASDLGMEIISDVETSGIYVLNENDELDTIINYDELESFVTSTFVHRPEISYKPVFKQKINLDINYSEKHLPVHRGYSEKMSLNIGGQKYRTKNELTDKVVIDKKTEYSSYQMIPNKAA